MDGSVVDVCVCRYAYVEVCRCMSYTGTVVFERWGPTQMNGVDNIMIIMLQIMLMMI